MILTWVGIQISPTCTHVFVALLFDFATPIRGSVTVAVTKDKQTFESAESSCGVGTTPDLTLT